MDARVWPTEEAMEEQLALELAPGSACVLGETDLTWEGLCDRAIESGPARRRPLDPVTQRLALRLACARASGLGPVATTPGFLNAVARFVADADRAALAVAPDEPLGVRARMLLRIHAELVHICEPLGASRDRQRGAAVRAGPRFAGAIDMQPRHVWEPADVELVLALARRGRVRVRLPWAPERPAIYRGLDAILAAFEARGVDLDLELALEDPAEHGPLRGLVSALYRSGAQAPAPRDEGAPLTIVSAPHPQGEMRAVAGRARALVDAGAAPESIAVALRQPGAEAELLAEALARAGLRLDDRRPAPLAAAPPARLLLALLALPERGFPRDEVLAFAASPYVTGGPPAGELARQARALGLRELGPRGAGLARLRAAAAPLADALAALLAPVAALPERAPLAGHARALAAAARALGVLGRARAFDPSLAVGGPAAAAVERALARDQAAAALLGELPGRIVAAADALGMGQPISRRDFAALLADLLGDARIPAAGARGGAVRLVALADLAARSFDHVLIAGLVDGAAPARALDDGVYGERERREINRAAGRRVLPTTDADAERTPFENLLLVCALAAARRSVVLSHARTADDRPLERSPFIDEVRRAAPWAPLVEAPLAPIASLAQAAGEADVLAAVALEALGDPEGRLPPRPRAPDADALLDELARRSPARAARLIELADIERRRWRWFAGLEPPGPHVGRIGAVALPDAPIPARQLEQLARCPFTFLAGRVLAAAPSEEADDAPSPLSLGRLAHRCLEVFYRARAAAGALPLRGDDDDRDALAAACADAFAEAEAQGVRGHPLLWQIGKERLVDELWRSVRAEAGWAGIPEHFELPFGLSGRGGPSLPALQMGGLRISGRIDRLDRAADGAFVVVDYKLGKTPRLKEAGATELQLPIYAAAVRAGLGATRVDAAYVSLREGPSRTLSQALGAAGAAALLDGGLEERLGELGDRVRAGAFEVQPADPTRCQFCSWRTACRVVHLEREEEAA